MSTLKVDALSSKTTNTNLTITADGSGLVDIETGFKVSGTAGVPTADIRADAITGAKIADDAIDSEHYTDASIDLAHMSVNSIDSDQYVDGSVDLVHMSANSVDSDQYVDGSIDLVHMSANSVDSDQYVDGSIDNAHIADDAIDSEHYAAGSIDSAHLADDAVTLAKMAGGTDGNIISYDASGNPVAIATGSDGQILTSTGAGSPPAFEAAASSGPTLDSSIATTTGNTIVQISTSIPAGTKQITVNLEGVGSTAGYQHYLVQIGDAGGFETTGYLGNADQSPMGNHTANTLGFLFYIPQTLTDVVTGHVTLTLADGSDNTWVATTIVSDNTTGGTRKSVLAAFAKSLSAELTSIRLFETSGVWAAGTVSITYQ